MEQRPVTIVNKLGLHARAAAKFVTTASGFASNIDIEKDGQKVNGKSIMGVMMLAASRGTRLTIRADGTDEREAVDSLERLIEEKFGEHE
ncbi:MAG TPA: HPr family phosphocarrier protein [Gammaproteobacteria bacterium]|nr:HPr family phosphocarrier protein [Gammaproteobacteria bacterium]